MQKPIPDGSFTIYFRNIDDNGKEFIDHYFMPMKNEEYIYSEGSNGIYSIYLKTRRTHFPMSNIIKVETIMNSDEYNEALKKFQDQHEHDWETHRQDGMFPGMQVEYVHCHGCGLSEHPDVAAMNKDNPYL